MFSLSVITIVFLHKRDFIYFQYKHMNIIILRPTSLDPYYMILIQIYEFHLFYIDIILFQIKKFRYLSKQC